MTYKIWDDENGEWLQIPREVDEVLSPMADGSLTTEFANIAEVRKAKGDT